MVLSFLRSVLWALHLQIRQLYFGQESIEAKEIGQKIPNQRHLKSWHNTTSKYLRELDMEESKGGSLSKYKVDAARQAIKLCLLGATDQDLANFFEVDERTANRWKDDHPEFCQSLKRGNWKLMLRLARGSLTGRRASAMSKKSFISRMARL